MDPFVVVSPHLDDAVLSCGQFIAGRRDTTVVTVYAGGPDDLAQSTEFDRNSGFASAHVAMRTRRKEDDAALKVLRSSPLRLGFIDDQYDNPEHDDTQGTVDAIVDSIRLELSSLGCSELLGPLGLAHPDHLAVSEACLALARSCKVWLYEELPSRVLWPDQVCARLVELDERGFDTSLDFIGTGPYHEKARAVASYKSQQWALDRRCLYVPERFHRVTAR